MPAIHRYVGPCLVNASYEQLADCVSLGRYPVLKVVATESHGLGFWHDPVRRDVWQHVPWDHDNNRLKVCNLTRWTIVRTETGNHGVIDPRKVADELRPWFAAKKASSFGVNPREGYSNLLIELGNEPNIVPGPPGTPATPRPAQDNERRQLFSAIDIVRHLNAEFRVAVKIICPGLAPVENLDAWLQLFTSHDSYYNRNLRQECHFFGVHFYAVRNWTVDEDADRSNGNNMRRVVDKYNHFVGNQPWWIVTEFGLRSGSDNEGVCDDFTKGYRNAGLMHYGESVRPLPAHVWGGTYWVLDKFISDKKDDEGGYAYYYRNGDWSYRNRLNTEP